MKRLRLRPYMLPLFLVWYVLEFTGRGSFGPWIAGIYAGIITAFFMRQYVVALTDRRLLLLRLQRLSGKKIDEAVSLDPALVDADFDKKIISWILTLSAPEAKYELQVSGASQAGTARKIADRLKTGDEGW